MLHRALVLVVIASVLLLAKSLAQNFIAFLEARFMPSCVANVAKDLFDYAHQHSTAFLPRKWPVIFPAKPKRLSTAFIRFIIIWSGVFDPVGGHADYDRFCCRY